MTREDLDYQGHYMRERMEEIKREIKDEYLEILDFDDPMDHYAGYDSSQDRIEGWIEDKAKEYGVSFDLMTEACNELDREAMDAGYAEMEWAYTPGNLTPEEFDSWYEGKLNIKDRIKSSKKIQSANLFASTTPCDVMLDNGKVAPAGCEFEVSYDRNEQGEYILGIKVKGLGKGSIRFDSEAEAKKDGWIVSRAIKSDAEKFNFIIKPRIAEDEGVRFPEAKAQELFTDLESLPAEMKITKEILPDYTVKVQGEIPEYFGYAARDFFNRWGVILNSYQIKSDAASEQKLKEDLIRQGYTEDEANQIVEQRKPQDVQSGKKVVKSDVDVSTSEYKIDSQLNTTVRAGDKMVTLDETPAEHIKKNLDVYKGYFPYDMEKLVLEPSGYERYRDYKMLGGKKKISYRKTGADEIVLYFDSHGELENIKSSCKSVD